MRAIVAAILYNFRNLVRFSERDIRAQFWPYAIFLFIFQMIVSLISMIPFMFNILVKTFQFAAQHAGRPGGPMGLGDQREFAQMMDGIFSDIQSMLMVLTPILTVIFVVMIAAAVTRRLHDRNRRGFWGLMPLPFTAFGIASMPIMLPGVWHHSLSIAWWAALILQNLFYYASLILLIVMLAGRDSAEPNRFGPAVTDWRFQP